jgi:hypothetical protein
MLPMTMLSANTTFLTDPLPKCSTLRWDPALGEGIADGALLVLAQGVHEQSLDGEGADHHFGVRACRGGTGVFQFGPQ